MSVNKVRTYNFDSVDLIIGGFDIGGYSDDGGIEFEMAADIIEDTVGADGETTVSYLNDNRVYCTITLKETSKGYADLAGLMTTQLETVRGGAEIPTLDFLMRDPISGDEVSDQYAVFRQRPGPSKARVAGDRAFQILLPNAASQISWGASIS